MTVSTTSNKITYDGNDVTTVFPFTFAVEDDDQIVVVYTDADGVETTLSPSVYSVTINAAVSPNPTPVGGSVTYNPSGTPIATGTKLTISRELDLTQTTSLDNQGTMYPQVIEQSLDYITMISQQLNELFGRAITIPISDSSSVTTELPTAEERALMYLAFASDGSVIATAGTSSTNPVSSAMEPVVSAASLAAGRTAFGLGDIAVEDMGAGLEDDGSGNVRVNNDISSDSTNQSVTSAFHQTVRIATGPITYTMPAADTLWNGFTFYIFAQTGLITLAIDAGDSWGNLASGTSLIVQPGTFVKVTTDGAATGVWYAETHFLGPAISSGCAMYNGSITGSVSGNAFTVSIKTIAGLDPSSQDPVIFFFRNATVGSGSVAIVVRTSTLSLTVPSGAEMGFINATAGRLWLGTLNNAGAVELFLINCRSGTNATGYTIYPLRGWGIITTTAMTTGSDSARVPYSTSARSAVAYATLGYFTWETGLTAVGTWDANPTRIQLAGYDVPLPGAEIQSVHADSGALATGTTQTPADDSIPTSTEGDQYITTSITPTSAANVNEVIMQGFFSTNGAADNVITLALFISGASAALATDNYTVSAANRGSSLRVTKRLLAASTSAVTYNGRAGVGIANTTTFNGQNAARLMGGVMNSFSQVRELMA